MRGLATDMMGGIIGSVVLSMLTGFGISVGYIYLMSRFAKQVVYFSICCLEIGMIIAIIAPLVLLGDAGT